MPFKSKEDAKEYWKTKKREQRMSNPVSPLVSNPEDMSNPLSNPVDISKVALPANIVKDIERVISDRAILGLPDDSEDRWRLAKEYQVWNDARLLCRIMPVIRR